MRVQAVQTTTGIEEAARSLQLEVEGKHLWLAPESPTEELSGDFIARLKKEAAAGSINAEATLALCYHVGYGVERNLAKAANGYQKAAKAGHPGAQNNLGNLYDFGLGVRADPTKAHELYLASANQHFADAQYNVALNYANGVAVPQDWGLAREWYLKAAAQGHLAALTNLGNIYLFGRGVPVNYETARKYLLKPAEAGLGVSQYSLAVTYLSERRFTEGIPWLRRSAEGGYLGGQVFWAASLWEGLGVPKDPEQALTLARKAAAKATGPDVKFAGEAYSLVAEILLKNGDPENRPEAFHAAKIAADAGNARGQHLLGICYHRGAGVESDLTTAIYWYRLAAAQKFPDAAFTLGTLSEAGRGMEQNYSEAAKWYRIAAEGGNGVAMYRLGLFCRDGTGVEIDLAEAAKWLHGALLLSPNDPDANSALAEVNRLLQK